MTSPLFGVGRTIRDAVRTQSDVHQFRQQVGENSTREAKNAFTYTTTGVGQLVMDQPLMFDCVFTEEPCFVSGVALVKPPDPAHYRYPLVTAGIYRWVQEPQKPKPAEENGGDIFNGTNLSLQIGVGVSKAEPVEDTSPQFYKGAFLYFLVKVDPLTTVRTNGSNLAQLQQAFNAADTAQRASLAPLIKEAQEAIYLKNNPAQLTIHHHLQFSGNAMKKLSDSVTALADDKMATPATPPVTEGL